MQEGQTETTVVPQSLLCPATLAQGFLSSLLCIHQHLASGKGQLPHVSSGQKVTSIQLIGQRQLLAWVEKACLGPVALWWQRWI